VYVTGRRPAELEEAVRIIGSGAVGVQGDISNLEDLDRLYAQIKREKGRLDVVFANAAAAALPGSARSRRNRSIRNSELM
jgi:NAD(P)-dependent dehydrogenase (short-subunit alcohol dehydrogenase family)